VNVPKVPDEQEFSDAFIPINVPDQWITRDNDSMTMVNVMKKIK
jgi:hypothetical protein